MMHRERYDESWSYLLEPAGPAFTWGTPHKPEPLTWVGRFRYIPHPLLLSPSFRLQLDNIFSFVYASPFFASCPLSFMRWPFRLFIWLNFKCLGHLKRSLPFTANLHHPHCLCPFNNSALPSIMKPPVSLTSPHPILPSYLFPLQHGSCFLPLLFSYPVEHHLVLRRF